MSVKKDDKNVLFKTALAGLNELQKKAVETIEGPVMVIAGPGTGKTQILTLRIANILLRTDTKPENILALTFTESGAKAMRDRLRQYIGETAFRVPIYTFHGFAQHLISNYPDAYTRIIGGKPATDIDKVELLETILREPGIKLLRPIGDQTYYVPALISVIGHLKQEYVSPDDLSAIIARQEADLANTEKIHQKGVHKGKVRGEYSTLLKIINKNKELQLVYRLYESALREAKLYDYDDMINETIKALGSDETLLRELQETFQYILADEHQDVNGSQNKILELLTNFHDSPNIFVVGDEKQAIYRFQGASLSNFLYFTDVFPTTSTIALTDNYRSGQEILDLAQELIKTDNESLMKLRVPLRAKNIKTANIELRKFSHQAVEDNWLVETIKSHAKESELSAGVAVIVRTNQEVESLTVLLRKENIPVTASADGDVLDHPITVTVESLLEAVLTSSNEEALFNVLQGAYWGIGLDDIVKITSARSYKRPLTSIINDKVVLQELGVKAIDKVVLITKVLEEARLKEVNEPPHRVLGFLLTESGLIKHLLTHDPYEGVRVVRRLYDEIEAMVIRDGVVTLKQVKKILAQRRQYHLPLTAPYIKTATNSVLVTTAHKAKGLEFSMVFIPHLQDSNWGGKRRAVSFKIPLAHYLETVDPEDDERRLLYVAMTRAKKSLYLSSASESIQGKDVSDSRLLTEAVLKQTKSIATDDYEKDFVLVSNLINETKSNFDVSILTTLLAARGVSATALNNLLKNPWDFFYRNILRVPEVQPLHMQFGTVVHKVLEEVTAFYGREKIWPEFWQLKNWLENQLGRLPIHTHEYVQLHEKGLEILAVYQEHLKEKISGPTREEVKLTATLTIDLPNLNELTLTGKLDRLDFSTGGQLLRVVDYKTGKPKSRAAIMGDTASSDGNYKRQLTFYSLLLSLHEDNHYQTKEGVLSFVEANQAGKICEEVVMTTDEEIHELKKQLIEAVGAFCRGEFLKDRTLAETSNYKDLAIAFLNKLD